MIFFFGTNIAEGVLLDNMNVIKGDVKMSMLDVWRKSNPVAQPASESFMRDFDPLFRDMERFFEPILQKHGNGFELSPLCDISENEDEYEFSIDLPGISIDDVNIEVLGNSLRVYGERTQEENPSRRASEKHYGKFSRTFRFPNAIKDKGVKASYSNGVLEIVAPKLEVQRVKKIKIDLH